MIERSQKVGLSVILIGIMAALTLGIWYSSRVESRILGTSDTRGMGLSPNQVLSNTLEVQMHRGYGAVIFVTLMAIGAGMIFQFVWILKKLGSDHKFGMGNMLKIAVLDLAIFVLTVFGLAGLNAWIVMRETPRNVEISRVTDEIVMVKWNSRYPVMSQVLWGYDPASLDMVELGNRGGKESVEHEVTIEVLPGQEVYLKLVSHGGMQYGQDREGNPYRVEVNAAPYVLEELELKEVDR